MEERVKTGGFSVRMVVAVLCTVAALLGAAPKEKRTLPVDRLLKLAGNKRTDPEVAYGAADLVLREGLAKESELKKALSILEKLARDRGEERYRVRAVIHYLRWPTKYEKAAGKLASASESDNAILSYALVACELKLWEDADRDKRAEDAAAHLKKAAEHLARGNNCERLETYQPDAIRAGVRALEKLGFSPFAARMAAFFQPETPHIPWMRAISVFYSRAADRHIQKARYGNAQATIGPVVVMGEKLRANTRLLVSELACIKMTRPALEKIRHASLGNRDFLTHERASRLETDLKDRLDLLQAYLVGLNEAMEPRPTPSKTEAEWTRFFDDVLTNGEVETIAADQDIDIQPAVLDTITTPDRPAR